MFQLKENERLEFMDTIVKCDKCGKESATVPLECACSELITNIRSIPLGTPGRARLSCPDEFEIKLSKIVPGQLGLFAAEKIPVGTFIGL